MQSMKNDPNRPAKPTMANTMSYIYNQNGLKGLYRGVGPRIGLGIWQTLCSNLPLLKIAVKADPTQAWWRSPIA